MMTTRPARRRIASQLVLAVSFAAGSAWMVPACRQAPPPEQEAAAATPPPTPTPEPAATPVPPETWAAAIARVEEVRSSPGRIEVPTELQHYDDRRRFLALQMADSKEEKLDIPHDQAELAEMIQRGELLEMRALGDDYILYDVGTASREDPLTHYDAASGKDVELFPSAAEYEAEDARLAEEARRGGTAGARAKDERELLASFYGDPARREVLFAEYRDVTTLAHSFRGLSYDLNDRADRIRFQVRLLSFIRPEARDVLLRLAHDYHERFGRRLPVTSLIRTQRYQRRMVRNSPNATGVGLAPHTTGMAFDISYKFMAPDEQNFVMEDVARLEDEGRVESLRERNNSIHVYTYADGHRPDEDVVTGFLPEVEAAHPRSAPHRVAAASRRKGGATTRGRAGHAGSRRASRHLGPRSR